MLHPAGYWATSLPSWSVAPARLRLAPARSYVTAGFARAVGVDVYLNARMATITIMMVIAVFKYVSHAGTRLFNSVGFAPSVGL